MNSQPHFTAGDSSRLVNDRTTDRFGLHPAGVYVPPEMESSDLAGAFCGLGCSEAAPKGCDIGGLHIVT